MHDIILILGMILWILGDLGVVGSGRHGQSSRFGCADSIQIACAMKLIQSCEKKAGVRSKSMQISIFCDQ
jgi:hypothetical protein